MSLAEWETLERALDRMTPAEKLELIERTARSLRVAPPDPARQRQSLRALQIKLAALPVANPADGFSARDHDRLLYGERQ